MIIIIIIISILMNCTFPKQDKDPVLEYQVGGRLNHTTFVLQLKKKRAEALGAIKVSRRKPQDSTHSDVGIVHLELTGFFQKQFTVPRGGQYRV